MTKPANFSWDYQIEKHEREHPNCDCGAEQDMILKDLPETASNREVLDCLDAWEEEKRMRKAERLEWFNTLYMTNDTPSTNGSPIFPAKWSGKCKECGERYGRGEGVGYAEGMEGPLCAGCHSMHDAFTPGW